MSNDATEPGQSKRIVLTGGAGFIGSHLSEKLISCGHTVTVLDNLSSGAKSNVQRGIDTHSIQFVRADVTNEGVMDRLASKTDVIVHLAAALGVTNVVNDPVTTLQINMVGAEAVLRAALRYGCRVILLSTSEVYGRGSRIPFSEDDDVVLGPTSKSRWGYACSKMASEFLGLAFHRDYGLPVTMVRIFNAIGPRQSEASCWVVPALLRQAMSGEPLTVFGDGRQTRCFVDVTDVAEALAGLCVGDNVGGLVFNVGNPREVSILELAELINVITGSSSLIRLHPYDDVYPPGYEDMRRRVPDITRIRSAIGWEPRIDLEESLTRIRNWMVETPRRADSR